MNRICLRSDWEGSEESSQLVMLCRSPKNLYPRTTAKGGLIALISISKFEELRNSTRASTLSLQLVLPHVV